MIAQEEDPACAETQNRVIRHPDRFHPDQSAFARSIYLQNTYCKRLYVPWSGLCTICRVACRLLWHTVRVTLTLTVFAIGAIESAVCARHGSYGWAALAGVTTLVAIAYLVPLGERS